MLLTSQFILNSGLTESLSIYPYLRETCNLTDAQTQLHQVLIPDTIPQPSPHPFSMSAGEFVEIYSKEAGEWDAIVTCFFLDTAHNILDYLEVIRKALKPTGIWINCGPLLYHYANVLGEISVELTWDEVSLAAEELGLVQIHSEAIESDYAENPRSMQRTSYNIQLTVWSFK